MRSRRFMFILLCLLCGAGAWFLWHHGRSTVENQVIAPSAVATRSLSTAPQLLPVKAGLTKATKTVAAVNTNQFAYRLSNTTKSLDQLVHDDRAILLENALIDTANPLSLAIPANLQAAGDPGAYIVQARGPIDNAFRALLARSGATVVSYIPNNAYLVRASSGVVGMLEASSLTQTVVPYEPYYKVQSSLLAYSQGALPEGLSLNLGLFGDDAPATISQITKLGGQIFAEDQSPFGPIVRIQIPSSLTANWTALARLPGVQIVEPFFRRGIANDLARVTLGVSTNSVTAASYLNLAGSNVIVEVNDTGIDQQHPDFNGGGTPRVIGDAPQSLVDTNGHGTHVAGIIAGDGTESSTINSATNVPQGSVTNANFRGKAPAAMLYSVGGIEGGADTNFISDQYFQQVPALTNALISNNSWDYGDAAYDLASASYDAAVRDALPAVTGSQPVLFVFAAGNSGGGGDSGGGGNADTILSPATAKDVITVGATEQLRNITNWVTALDGTSNQVWKAETDTGYQVAGYSSRGNVGIGVEGTFGRFKPDVVAPGTFVVSTRSEQWDTNAYYNPTNVTEQDYTLQTVTTNTWNYYSIDLSTIPNAVGVTLEIFPNLLSPSPLTLPIYVATTPDPTIYPIPGSAGTYFSAMNIVTIPPNGPAGYLAGATASGGFNFAVGDSGSQPISYDLSTFIYTTNDLGNYFHVLQTQLNDPIGPWYRYETGTSMATPSVSGVLALMQDFFTNRWHTLPSPALLKAMLINGARKTANYNFQVQNLINFQGWGMASLPSALQPGLTNQFGVSCSDLILDQNPTNALATGDSRTFFVSITNAQAQAQPLRITLAWTDPPGDPAAAIKLVNNLVLVVTNFSNSTNSVIYYGNDIASGNTFNTPETTNKPAVFDSINNVQNVYISPLNGTNFSVTVLGYRVNVNAVTAQTNNVVQDYALVISSGDGLVTNAMTVTAAPPTPPNYTGDQNITYVTGNANALLNQYVGASSPLLGTNTLPYSTTTAPAENFGSNWQITIGMTNQWHFYVVTNPASNTSDFTNAAFVTFVPDTLSVPRMGVFGGSVANATRPEADIDLYVASGPNASGLTNLDPSVISNCVVGTQVGQSLPPGVAGVFNGASLGRLGTEFVVDTNSTPGQVYYVGVKSEDQMASEYGFISLFSNIPFSQMNKGNEIVNGIPLVLTVPGGNPAVPGFTNVFGLAIYPITEMQRVVITNSIYAGDLGDLVGSIYHNTKSVLLNNHTLPVNGPGAYTFIYDDSGQGDIVAPPASGDIVKRSDGPGSLNSFAGTDGTGVWILHEADNAEGFTNIVNTFNMLIQPHQPLTVGVPFTIPPGTWFYGYVDVPPGATNLTVTATNYPPAANPPLELFVKLGAPPTTNNFDGMALINIPGALGPWGSVSLGPPLTSGRYWVGIFNPSSSTANGFVFATIGLGVPPGETIYSSGGPVPILDDAVTTNNIVVPDDQTISSMEVALRVDHPRISDLVFHLIGPDGTRDLLVENRGGNTANMGATLTASNGVVQPQTFSGGSETSTNVIDTGQNSGTLSISYNFFTLPDELAVYDGGTLIFDSGLVSGSGVFNIPYTGTSSQLTIVMNPNGNNSGPGDAWTFTVNSIGAAYTYLVLTEDTNKTTTPIKFAVPPFVPVASGSNVIVSDFETAPPGDYTTTVPDETTWNVLSNQVTVVTDPTNADSGTNFLALANGTVSTTLPTVAGQSYALTFRYRGPDITGWWRGESNAVAVDSAYGNNGVFGGNLLYVSYTNGFVGDAFSIGPNPYGVYSGVDVTDAPAYAITNSLSMEGWVKPLGDGGNILWRGDNRPGLDPYFLGTTYSPQIEFAICDAAGNYAALLYTSFAYGQWYHVAGTLDGNSGAIKLYVNGNLVAQSNTTIRPFGALIPGDHPGLGIGNVNDGGNNFPFDGDIDEISLYSRALSASEVKAIYNEGIGGNAKGGNGKFDPAEFSTSPLASLAEAQVTVNGGTPATFFGSNTNWQTKTIIFTATQPGGTPLQLTGVEPGMLLDSFSLSQVGGDLYYLPEQSLDTYDGLNASGPWSLEIQDNRVGATNPAPMLLSWQLRFNYVTTGTSSSGTPPGITTTNIIPPYSFAYYPVNVPTNADYATNILVFATGPLNMWFNPTNDPTGANPPDSLLLGGVTNGSSTLSTFSVPTNIVPGGVYYIGLQNTNAFPVTNGFEVDFHLYPTPISLTNGVPVTNTVSGTIAGDGMAYYSVTVPPDADYATNLLLSSTTPVNVWFNQNKVPVGLTPPDSLLISNATNGIFVLSAGSTPPLVPGTTYYLAVQNTNGPSATFALEVNFHRYTPLTNGVPATNSVPPNGFAYYTVTVPTNADYATNRLLFASLPVNVWFNQFVPPTGLYPTDFPLISNATNGTSILSAGTTPPLVPGATYYLGVQNTNSVPVNFGLEVDFHLVIPPGISGLTITPTNNGVTNGFLLQWSGPTNYQYTIQWATHLAPPIPWNTVLNPVINLVVTPTNGNYSWFDDGSLAGGFPPVKFYRVLGGLISAPITNSTPVTNVVVAGTFTPLIVNVPANAIAASNLLVSATGPLNVWFNQTTPPTTSTNAGNVLMLSNVTSGSFLLTSHSVPPLVPGASYYLGLQNTGTTNVVFVFDVNFAYAAVTSNAPTISSITLTNLGTTNGILLTWFAPANDRFQVQWTTSLSPASWTTIPGVILTNLASFTPTNGVGEFQYFDNGSMTGGFGLVKFYRLIAYAPGATIPPDLIISSVLASPGGLQVQWHGSTNYIYDVLWTTNLGLPTASWNVLTNLAMPVPLSYSGGVFTFTATNALTGGSAPAEFFQVQLWP
ncbi:MAG: S8 family serine peptidase [Verrucomicrobiota bacterium]